MKTTAVLLRGSFDRQNTSYDAQLFSVGSKCKIKVLGIALTPDWPSGRFHKKHDRTFQVSTNLITSTTYPTIGEPSTEETPIMMFSCRISKDLKQYFPNDNPDYYKINYPSQFCRFSITAVDSPHPSTDPPQYDYFYDATLHLAIEIPE
jgi:hypothetical protein